jgi:hypothetical protein
MQRLTPAFVDANQLPLLIGQEPKETGHRLVRLIKILSDFSIVTGIAIAIDIKISIDCDCDTPFGQARIGRTKKAGHAHNSESRLTAVHCIINYEILPKSQAKPDPAAANQRAETP